MITPLFPLLRRLGALVGITPPTTDDNGGGGPKLRLRLRPRYSEQEEERKPLVRQEELQRVVKLAVGNKAEVKRAHRPVIDPLLALQKDDEDILLVLLA